MDKLLPVAQQRAGAAGVQEQVAAQYRLRVRPGAPGDHLREGPRRLPVAEQGIGVHIGLVFHAVIGVSVHMDGHIGDHQQVPVHMDQPLGEAPLLTHQHPARHRQGPVQPGGHKHPAVLFRVQLNIVSQRGMLRVFLDLEAGGIAVGRRHQKAPLQGRRRAEGDDGGSVPGDKIPPAGDQLPPLLLPQAAIARPLEHFREVLRHMIAAGAVLDKRHQLSCQILCLFHGISSVSVVAAPGRWGRFLYHWLFPPVLSAPTSAPRSQV